MNTQTTIPQANEIDLRALASRFAGNCDVLCLHPLSQPLVDELQKAIRYQQEMIQQQTEAIEYVLGRVRDEIAVSYVIGFATESFGRMTAAVAMARGVDVDSLRESYLKGSASMYRERNKEEAA